MRLATNTGCAGCDTDVDTTIATRAHRVLLKGIQNIIANDKNILVNNSLLRLPEKHTTSAGTFPPRPKEGRLDDSSRNEWSEALMLLAKF